MANSEDMQAAIMQEVTREATAVVRAMREADLPNEAHTRRSSPEEPHKTSRTNAE